MMSQEQITGRIVADWVEFGHHFQIELLAQPVLRGAGYRSHRLWDNGSPATGGQWHWNDKTAQARAKYLLECSYIRRIQYLEQRVQQLESQLWAVG